jgi:hypothetical protein
MYDEQRVLMGPGLCASLSDCEGTAVQVKTSNRKEMIEKKERKKEKQDMKGEEKEEKNTSYSPSSVLKSWESSRTLPKD